MSLYKINTITCTIPALKCGDGAGLKECYTRISQACQGTAFTASTMSNWNNKVTMKLNYRTHVVVTYSSNGFPHIVGLNSVEDIHALTVGIRELYVKAGVTCPLDGRELIDTDIQFHMINASRISKVDVDTDPNKLVAAARERGLHVVYEPTVAATIKMLYYINSEGNGKCTCPMGVHIQKYSENCKKIAFSIYRSGSVVVVGGNNACIARLSEACAVVEAALGTAGVVTDRADRRDPSWPITSWQGETATDLASSIADFDE